MLGQSSFNEPIGVFETLPVTWCKYIKYLWNVVIFFLTLGFYWLVGKENDYAHLFPFWRLTKLLNVPGTNVNSFADLHCSALKNANKWLKG